MKFIQILLSLLVTPFAFAADAAEQPGSMGPMVFIFAMMVLMYLMVWRPQQKKAKEHAALVDSVKQGDEVLMNSGLLGKVTAAFDTHFEVEIADNVKVLVQKNAVASSLPKGSLKSIKGKID